MGETASLMARDGHEFHAWLAAPRSKPRGAVVVVQEIFGVNHHVRAVADHYAAQGYTAIAPALFDRIRRGVDLGYTAGTTQEGIGYMLQVTEAQYLADVGAAINAVRGSGKVGIVGFCWGGTVAYVAACKLPVAAAACYYGGAIVKALPETPKCPVIYHFGEHDSSIPPEAVAQIRAAHPAGHYHLYPAGHAFSNADRPSYEPHCAQLALERTQAFFAEHVG